MHGLWLCLLGLSLILASWRDLVLAGPGQFAGAGVQLNCGWR